MEAAQQSVSKFMSISGHHKTSYHETAAPAVQNETVVAKQHEEQTTAVDREIHQDHYHTTVQPVQHQEVLPEQHHHNLKEVEHRTFEHDDKDKVNSRLSQEQSQFRDTSQRVDGERTTAAVPNVIGEHVHHHVYETVQPVIHKQTIEPHIVHTTIPIHEVHHNAAQHHEATTLPALSMDDFLKQSGVLNGREALHKKYDGCPPEHGERGVDGRCGHPSHHRDSMSSSHSKSSTPIFDEMSGPTKSTPTSPTTSTPRISGGSGRERVDSPLGSPSRGSVKGKPQKKSSLLDKINPRKDANGDGKAGIFS